MDNVQSSTGSSRKKLIFLHHLIYLDKYTLANEIFTSQKEYNLPGFVQEGRQLLLKFGLPNIIDDIFSFSKYQWKKLVKAAVKENYEIELKEKIIDQLSIQLNSTQLSEE